MEVTRCTRFGYVLMHRHMMVEHNSQVSHTFHGRNAIITNVDDVDWHVHFNIGSRECYHFRLVVV